MKGIFTRAAWRSLAWSDFVPVWVMLQLSISSLLNLGTVYATGGMGLALLLGVIDAWARPKAFPLALASLSAGLAWCALGALNWLPTSSSPVLLIVLAASDALLLIWAAIVAGRMGGVRELSQTVHRQRRIACDIEAVLQFGDDRDSCRVIDLSGGGLLARIPPLLAREMREGDVVTVWFEYARMPLTVEARVIHKDRKGPSLCGMQFIESQGHASQ
ncbi:MAG TPA: PilZ domain-containing protein [Bdellovibrionota bacterium]|nr:PilZ domain-containing protein [Bdellovibrionota bacterium]